MFSEEHSTKTRSHHGSQSKAESRQTAAARGSPEWKSPSSLRLRRRSAVVDAEAAQHRIRKMAPLGPQARPAPVLFALAMFSQILDAVAMASPSSINATSTGVAEIDLPGKGQILVSQRSATSYSMATARVDRNVLSGRISIIAAAL
jgi:hypothetical protein